MSTDNKRRAFFISDGTGITAGSLGGLLAHFPNTEFEQIRIPFTDSHQKIEDAQKECQCKINKWYKADCNNVYW